MSQDLNPQNHNDNVVKDDGLATAKLLRMKVSARTKPSRIQMTLAMTIRKMSLRMMITLAMSMWLIIEALYRVHPEEV